MTDNPDRIDVHVGSRLRSLRKVRGKSQEQLAAALGLTFQQVQKYEKAANRISASMLFRAGAFLGVAPGYFFEGLDAADPEALPSAPDLTDFPQAGMITGLKPDVRRAMGRLIETLAET